MKIKTFQFLSLLLAMLVTGVFWGTWFTLTRSIDTFSPSVYLAIGQKIIRNIGIPMRILMPGTLFTTATLLWIMPNKKCPAFYFISLSLFLMIAATLVTVLVEVPIDFQIRDWTLKTLPSNWESIRRKWEFFHSMRTWLSITGFAALTLGCLKESSRII